MTDARPPCVVLLSGGLDSATVLAIALEEGFRPACLSFRYGQRHHAELAAAHRVARGAGVSAPQVIDIDLRAFGGSALTDEIDVPKDRPAADLAAGIPVTYVPARNTIMLSFALAKAEVMNADAIFIGVNALDYSGYPDCRPAFVSAFEALANVATRAVDDDERRIKIRAPLIDMTKAEIITRGRELGVDYGLTLSCYDPVDELACGRCDACQLRRDGFAAAGVEDPTRYR